jgi:DNA-binding response OmpR family regulator
MVAAGEPHLERLQGETAPMPHTGSGSSLQKKVLLIVASEALRERISHLLRNVGLQIQVAANGKQVIAQVRNFHPDLLLLQVSLPDIDGREVCRQLRRDPRTLLLPIVIVSEKDDIQDAILGLDAGHRFSTM